MAEAVMPKFKNDLGLRTHARRRAFAALSFACLLLTASVAGASPIVYSIVGGTVDIDVKLDGVVIGSTSGVALTGDSVTVDAAAMTVDAIRIEIAPTMISLSERFGGYDEITVESAILEGTMAFTTIGSCCFPSNFTAFAGPLTVNGSWGATDSTMVNPDTSGHSIIFDVLTLSAVVMTNPNLMIDQVTINSIDGTPFGEPGKFLTIVASYTVLTAAEPETGLLVVVGLVALAWWRRGGSATGIASRRRRARAVGPNRARNRPRRRRTLSASRASSYVRQRR